MEYTKKNHDWGVLVLRIGVGLAFALIYGYPKIMGGPDFWVKLGGSMANIGINFAPTFWGFMSAITEFGGGILIILGLLTRPVAFLMAFNMIIATIQHLKLMDPWNKVISPIEMLTIFLTILIIGGGRFSLDYLISRNRHVKVKTVGETTAATQTPLRNTV